MVNVSDENDNARGCDCDRTKLSGSASSPYVDSWSAIGLPNVGPGFVETINVTGIAVEPESSVATKSKETEPVSWACGVPKSERVELSSRSHSGEPDSV